MFSNSINEKAVTNLDFYEMSMLHNISSMPIYVSKGGPETHCDKHIHVEVLKVISSLLCPLPFR